MYILFLEDDIVSKNRDNEDLKVKIDMPLTIDRVSVSFHLNNMILCSVNILFTVSPNQL